MGDCCGAIAVFTFIHSYRALSRWFAVEMAFLMCVNKKDFTVEAGHLT